MSLYVVLCMMNVLSLLDVPALTSAFKVVSQNSDIISPICVDAVLAIIDPLTAANVDLADIKIVKQVSKKPPIFSLGCLLSPVFGQSSPLSILEYALTTLVLFFIFLLKIGGTVDDTELVHGLVFDKGAKKSAGGPTRVANAKIGLIQFCLSAPKVTDHKSTDHNNNQSINDCQPSKSQTTKLANNLCVL